MKLLILVCLVAVVVAAPPSRTRNDNDKVKILSYENDNIGLGKYRYAFSQSDGTKQEQEAKIRSDGVYVVKGSFSWIGPDGYIYTIKYIADDKGYQPEYKRTNIRNEVRYYESGLISTALG